METHTFSSHALSVSSSFPGSGYFFHHSIYIFQRSPDIPHTRENRAHRNICLDHRRYPGALHFYMEKEVTIAGCIVARMDPLQLIRASSAMNPFAIAELGEYGFQICFNSGRSFYPERISSCRWWLHSFLRLNAWLGHPPVKPCLVQPHFHRTGL